MSDIRPADYAGLPRCEMHRKVLHDRREDALAEADRRGDPDLIAYRCRETGLWHLGHHAATRARKQIDTEWTR